MPEAWMSGQAVGFGFDASIAPWITLAASASIEQLHLSRERTRRGGVIVDRAQAHELVCEGSLVIDL